MNKIWIKIKNFVKTVVNKIGDKNTHMLSAFLITFIIGLFNILMGVLISCVVGLAKEIYDQFRYEKYGEGTGFNKTDLVYDMFGILIAIAVLLLL